MISLFENFNNESNELYNSLKMANIKTNFVVIDDDGFLPKDVISPYQFFANNKSKGKEKYFNEISLPEYWSIEANNTSGKILNMNNQRGIINYQPNYKNRIVNNVVWHDLNGKIRWIDYYNKQGIKYAEKVYADGNPILMHYYDENGKEIIYHNLITNHFIVTWKGKDYYFNNKTSFVIFFLEQLGYENERFIINSLSYPYFIVNRLESKNDDFLFWQEGIGKDIPGNMKVMIDNNQKRNFKIVIPDNNIYNKVLNIVDDKYHDKFVKLGYIYKYRRNNMFRKSALTLTNTDQIFELEQIIKSCPEISFNIAAITEMSTKLTGLDKYKNVKLYPNMSPEIFKKLYKECDIYLDINDANEIKNAVRHAFDNELLIMGYSEVAHNKRYVHNDLLFSKNNVGKMIETLKRLVNDKQQFKDRLSLQKFRANEVTNTEYKNVFK